MSNDPRLFEVHPDTCGNGHLVDAHGVCSHEREFLASCKTHGRDPEDVRQNGWCK